MTQLSSADQWMQRVIANSPRFEGMEEVQRLRQAHDPLAGAVPPQRPHRRSPAHSR